MRHDIVHGLVDTGAVAVIRLEKSDKLMRTIEAVRAGGITAIEITMTTPQAIDSIERAATKFLDEEMLIGVGSVLDGTTARQAIDAGAQFVVSPVLEPDIITTSHRYDVPALPGALTPTEVSRAHELGADIVKIFPASTVGPAFLSALHGPMPHLNLMPTGGVNLSTAGDWIRAGACTVGVGSALLDQQAISDENYGRITEHAQTLRASIDEARR